jgi:hypothetical protein
MKTVFVFLVCISVVALALGFYAWKLTGSRSIIFSTLAGGFGLLLSAYLITQNIPLYELTHQAIWLIPFYVTLLFLRGGSGLWRRSREKEPELGLVATLLLIMGFLSLIGTIAAFRIA